MKENRAYKIDIYGLKLGVHEFDFEFNKELFEIVEDSVIESGNGICSVRLDKKETLISIDFKIDGIIELTCDRSLKPFNHSVNITENLIVKYGEEFDDSRDDLLIISNTQESINIERYLYEYISLAVPMKKIHPDYLDDDEEEGEIALVYTSEEEHTTENEESDAIDPRWAALKKIKDLKK